MAAELTIVQLTDLHIGASWTEEPLVALEAAVRCVLGLDSVRDGQAGGELDEARRAWLERTLAAAPHTPTLLAMHHPPLVTGIRAMDELGFPVQERLALAALIERHPQVHVIAAGHVHRTILGRLGATPVLTSSGTDGQLALQFDAPELRFAQQPASFALHALVEGRIVSHVQPIPPRGR